MYRFTLLTSLLLSLTLGFSSCSLNKKANNMSDDAMSTDSGNFEVNGDSDSSSAGDLRTVNFEFNSAALSATALDVLQGNADFLQNNPTVTVQVEGHCDERGGVQYNIALGERRANTVRDHLVSLGIGSDRISTISYGKERHIAFGHDEESWGRNRRGNFVITAK